MIRGPADSPYAGGVYHGKLVFPPQYPFKPPSIQMHTPNGRFKTDTRLCLSMSDFHPETWSPLWSVGSILSGLLSFMLETTPTQGSIETSDATKREYALRSMEHNRKNVIFRKLFMKYIQQYEEAERENASDPAAESSITQPPSSSTATPAPTTATSSDTLATASANPPSTGSANSSTLKQRRPVDANANAVAGVDAAGAVYNGGAPLQPPPMLELFGGRIRLREESIYDTLVVIIVILTCIFAAIYMQNQ